MSEWSNEKVLNFLESYQEEQIIWDPLHKHHKDKRKVADAWGRLSIRFNTSVKELKLKRDTLMGTFRRHLKKKQDSIRSGAGADDVYAPIWFAYPLMESFLMPVYTTKPTINTEESTSQLDQESFGVENESDRTGSLSSPVSQTEETQSFAITSAKRPRRRSAPDPAEQQMVAAFSQLTNALSNRQSQCTPPNDDECDLYAKLLATKLREFSKDERKLIMYEIDAIFVHKIQKEQSGRSSQSPSTSTSNSVRLSSSLDPNTNVSNQPKTPQTSFSEPCLPSTAHTSDSEPRNKKYIYLNRLPSSQSSNNYTILPSSGRFSNTCSIQPPTLLRANSVHPVSVQIQTPSMQIPYTNSFQPLHVQSSNSSEARTNPRSNIINMALLNAFENFDSNKSLE